jgi:uncharacterized protein YdhG (YjbR/CyaY superfamily)
VLEALQEDVAGYSTSKGTLQFSIDTPLPRKFVEKLLAVRIHQALGDRFT